MKGFTKDKKFHPITETHGVRKSRDHSTKTKGIRIGTRRARGDNNSEILKNRLRTFNEHHSPQIEFGNKGGKSNFLLIKNTQRSLTPPVSKSEAIDYLSAIEDYITSSDEEN